VAFKPGVSGNPRGRPRRARTGPDKLRADLLRQAPEILARLVELAKTGDAAASKLLLDRCLPALKPQDRPVSLPLGPDLTEAGKAVLASLAVGTLTPDQASSIAATIGSLARSAELIEFEQRLDDIERKLNERKQP
jgi:hypothetical protein